MTLSFKIRMALRAIAPVSALAICASAHAGTLAFQSGSWGSFTGTGAGTTSAYNYNADSGGLGPSLTLTSPASGDNFTLGGTYSFSVIWTPATGDTVPSSITVTFHRQGTLTVGSAGVAEILNGSTALLEMDATNNYLSGATSSLSDTSVTLGTLTLQSDGTYLASGSFTTDTLSTTYNTNVDTVTTCQEIFTVGDMETA